MIKQLMKLKELRDLELKTKTQRDKEIESLPIVEEFEIIKQERETIEREIRELAINKYNETGLKKFGQIGIRITTKYNYDDLEALTWAKSHNLCLALDKIAFKKQLKVQPLDFVEVQEVPIATIPTEINGEEE